MAKLAGKNGTKMLPDEGVQKVADKLLDSLEAKRDGAEVVVAIPKPAGFNDAMKKLQEILPMMMMGGMQGGPPGDDF